MDDNYTGGLPAYELPKTTPVEEISDAVVHQVRINYHSGAYIQSWYSKFDVTTAKDGTITAIDLELAEVHPDAAGDLTFPIAVGIKHIESAWVIQTRSAVLFYNETCPPV